MFEKIAYAETAQSAQQVNPITSFLPLILIFVIFYFLLIRPQQKRQKELQVMIGNLKKGDRVITAGGLVGIINSIQDDYVVLKLGDNDAAAKVEILKSSITGLRK